ncbi:MAG: dehypoxanthine futalosine cyclase [Armatimonadetes bacterium]|nr:dehypoxanthine futalosine cyclase [Armatimonadota bacterium]
MYADAILAASRGARISCEDAISLLNDGSLSELSWAAERICEQKHPGGVRTYVIDRNINYTNICVSECKFCAFYRAPDDPDAYVLSTEDILTKIREAIELGATQILMQGGLHPDLGTGFFEALFRRIKDEFDIQLHCLSAPEIVHIAKISGLDVAQTLTRLREAGLDSLPGGGAEILVDGVRTRVSPNKCSADEWLNVMRTAARQGMRATATMLFGMGESLADRVEHMVKVRSLQDETGVFTAFIPWTFQPGNTALGGTPAGAHDYLRTLALSRLFLDNIQNIQASWVTQGAAIAQLAMRCGANDIGSTMIEENVVAAAGCSHSMDESELINLIHNAGFDAAQRSTLYDVIHNHPRHNMDGQSL